MSNPEEALASLKNEIDRTFLSQMMSSMGQLCFDKCVLKPGNSLEPRDVQCIHSCTERFMDTIGIVSKAISEAK